MNALSNKTQNELNKLINIAKNYSEYATISESLFLDVIHSINEDNENISILKRYLLDEGVTLTSDDNEDDYGVDGDSNPELEKITPFDTSRIDISPKPLTIDSILARLENDEIDLLPEFQRRSDLWNAQQKSMLIESLLLRIPLPAFYFDGSDNSVWVVIDGLQRLCALKAFFIGNRDEKGNLSKMALSGMEFLTDLNGTTIDDMPRAYIRRMRETQVTAYIINPGAPIKLKYNIFKRINTGGLKLEPQEIRHALYQGYATKFLAELANLDKFRETTGYSVKTERMQDREYILRFIAFYEQGHLKYEGSIDSFLNDAMEIINKKYDPKKTPNYAEETKIVFIDVLTTSSQIFDKFAFRRMPDILKRRTLSKALFETWTTCLAKLSKDERKYLVLNKGVLISKYMDMYNEKEFTDSLGSAKITSVTRRFEKIQELIDEVIKND
jgi:hypothetical protein